MSRFGWEDYTVFGGMLVVSTGIGLYQGCTQGNSAKEFLTGGGQMSTWPVALSMLASFLSSITLMGQPAEVYLYGSQLWLFGLSSLFIVPVVGYFLVPFFREKNHFSAYQYFGERFGKGLELLSSIIFTVQMVLYLSLVLYAPALAMHQVTGINILLVVTVMYVVCIFYTTIGGMKAVVWTDTFQVIVLYTSLLAVLAKGTYDIGGIDVILQKNAKFGRTQWFNWDTDMTERYTFWSSFFGAGFLHLSTYGGNQLQIQRYLTVSSTKEARKMLCINAVGWSVVIFMTVYTGMLIFAAYSDCDPLTSHKIEKADQLFPLYVMETLHQYPGFPGLFICGIFSAGLSTVSTGVNSLAAIWYAELESLHVIKKITDYQSGLVVKYLALGFGILSYMVVFLVPYMGGLVQLAVSLSSIFAGSLLGLFILGVYFPNANSFGATVSLLTSLTVLCWMSMGNNLAIKAGQIVDQALPVSIEGCTNITINQALRTERVLAPTFYRISYTWYGMIAIGGTVVVGVLVSFLSNLVRGKTKTLLNRATVLGPNNLLLREGEVKPVIVPC